MLSKEVDLRCPGPMWSGLKGCISRHGFISWLIARQRLLTMDNLKNWALSITLAFCVKTRKIIIIIFTSAVILQKELWSMA